MTVRSTGAEPGRRFRRSGRAGSPTRRSTMSARVLRGRNVELAAVVVLAGLVAPDSAHGQGAPSTRFDLVRSAAATMKARDRGFNAVVAVPSSAEHRANDLDARFGERSAGPLDRRLFAIKANIDMAERPADAGARVCVSARRDCDFVRRGEVVDAEVVRRIRDAGGLIVAVTNMDTWARGISSISERYGSTGNAWDLSRSPFGSSGGAAVAVARGYVDAAIATDTCGSIRYPASANGVFGLRPSVGSVSLAGIVPLSPTQDSVGPIARDPALLKAVFDVIREPAWAAAVRPVRRRVGVLRAFGRVEALTLERLRTAGVETVEVPSSLLRGWSPVSVINDEFSDARRQWLAGTWSPRGVVRVRDPSSYQRRLGARHVLAATIEHVMDRLDVDALVYPTTSSQPSGRGQRQHTSNCWLSANSGLPALTVPGPVVDGFPLGGIDLLGRAGDDDTLLALAGSVPRSPVAE